MKNRLLEKFELNEQENAWDVVIAGFFLIMLLYGSYYCFGIFLKPILSELGWSRAVTSGTISVYMVVHGASGMLMGFLSDKYGVKIVMMVNTLIIALGYYCMSKITEPLHLYLSFGLLAGFGMGAAFIPPIAAVTKWFVLKRGLAVGIAAAGVGVGQMIFPPGIRYLITIYGWRTSLSIMGVFIGVIGFFTAMLLRNPPLDIAGKTDDNLQTKTNIENNLYDYQLKEAIRTLPFFLLLFTFTALIFSLSIVTTHLVAHVEDMGFNPVSAALVLTLIGASGILGRIIIGGIADRYKIKILLPACLILQAVLLLSLIRVDDLQGFYIVAALYGLGYGGTLPLVIKMNTDFFGMTFSGTIFGVLLFGATTAGAIGAPFAGYVYDTTGCYSLAFLTASIILLTGSLLSLAIKAPEPGITLDAFK